MSNFTVVCSLNHAPPKFNHLIPTTKNKTQFRGREISKINLNCIIRRYCNTPSLTATNQHMKNTTKQKQLQP